MGKSTVEVTINRPADVVWDVIRDFGDLGWRGGIASCTVEGDVRSVRPDGIDLVVEETEVHRDEARRTFSYGVTAMRGQTRLDLGSGRSVDLASMVGHHRATMTVVPVDDGTSRLVYDLDIDDGHDDTLRSGIRQYRAVIERLKGQLET
jgi:mxaD protein